MSFSKRINLKKSCSDFLQKLNDEFLDQLQIKWLSANTHSTKIILFACNGLMLNKNLRTHLNKRFSKQSTFRIIEFGNCWHIQLERILKLSIWTTNHETNVRWCCLRAVIDQLIATCDFFFEKYISPLDKIRKKCDRIHNKNIVLNTHAHTPTMRTPPFLPLAYALLLRT